MFYLQTEILTLWSVYQSFYKLFKAATFWPVKSAVSQLPIMNPYVLIAAG